MLSGEKTLLKSFLNDCTIPLFDLDSDTAVAKLHRSNYCCARACEWIKNCVLSVLRQKKFDQFPN